MREVQRPSDRNVVVLTLIVLIALVALSGSANAQTPPIAELRRQHVFGQSGDAEGAQEISDVEVNVPLTFGRTLLAPGLAYHADEFRFEGDGPLQGDRALHSVGASLLLQHHFESGWGFRFKIAAAMEGELDNFDSGMLRGDATAMLMHRPSDGFEWGVGAVVTNALGGFLPIPKLYLRWEPSEMFRIEGSLPEWATATVSLGNRVEITAHGEIDARNYGAADCEGDGCVPVEDILTMTASARVGVGVRLISRLWLDAHFGRTLHRSFEAQDASGENVAASPGTLGGGYIAGVGLSFRGR